MTVNPSPRIVLALAAGLVLALAAASVGVALGSSSSRSASGAFAPGKRTIKGVRGTGKLLAAPPKLTPADTAIGEEEAVLPGPRIVATPKISKPAIRDATDLTRARRNAAPLTALRGTALPALPRIGKLGGSVTSGLVKPAGAIGSTENRATQERAKRTRAASGTDFTFFRNQDVPTGSNGSIKGEPSVGNDRNVILFTGNKYAAVSTDNGINFSWIDPKSFDDADGDGTVSDPEKTDGGYCCDQLVNASDENGHELISWLLQYFSDSGGNTVRLVTYQGKDDLEKNTYCSYDFTPSDFDLPAKRWLDYSSMQNSDGWLYMTTNIFDFGADDSPGGDDDRSKGSVIYRVKLSDLTDGDCSLGDGFQFEVNADRFSAALTQNAGSTMYIGSHPTNASVRIQSIADSSTSISSKTVSVSAFGTGTSSCKTPDGNNPCENLSTRIVSGWVGNGGVGFAWSAPEGGDYAFPQSHFALFNASSLALNEEHTLWNASYAWVWPAVGVNSRGDLGVQVYRIGGGQYPGARAFIVDDVETWGTTTVHSIISSSFGPDRDEWGDYGTVSRFDSCSKTWQAGAFALTGGSGHYGDTSVRYAWFGRERDGCPDLVVDRLSHLFDSDRKIVWLADVTRNSGAGESANSQTRYYLSRDETKSSNDIEIAESHAVGSLSAGESAAKLVEGTLPSSVRPGSYRVIACADATDVVAEITNTNNCAVDSDTLTVKTVIPTITRGTITLTPPATTTRPTITRPTITRPGLVTTQPTLTQAGPTTKPTFTRPTITRPGPTTQPTLTRPTITRPGPARTIPKAPAQAGTLTAQTQR